MISSKSFLWIFSFIFIISQVFAVGVFDDYGEFTYYVNSQTPSVDINISSGSRELQVTNAILNIDESSQEFEVDISDVNLNLFETKMYSFKVEDDISLAQDIRFELFVYDSKTKKIVKPYGDPTDFKIKYDDVKPELLSVENKINDDNTLILNFNKKISSIKITADSQSKIFNNVRNYKLKYDKSIIVDMSDFDFSSELYNVTFVYEDLAGNAGTKSENVYVHSGDLTIKLLTLQNDSSLKYNYDSKYVEFFNETIYSKSNEYELKIKTNKPAECFFSSGLSSFKEFNEVMEKNNFLSSDKLNHRISVDQYDNEIWVACKNVNSNSELVYLSEVMGFGKNLIKLRVYEDGELNILNYEPKVLVTNNPFSLFANTNNRAVCRYKLDSKDYVDMNTTDYKEFVVPEVETNNGKHNLGFECFDVLNNRKDVVKSIDVNPNLGVRVVDYAPKYVGESSANIEFSLSEFDGIECKYNDERASSSDFDKFFEITGTGIARSFLVTGLKEGSNDFFVYCKKNDQITWSKVDIVYDTKGVVIENLTFVNGKYRSDYIGNDREFEIDYVIDSLIPVEKVVVNISLENGSLVREFSGNTTDTLKGIFNGAKDLKLTATNAIGQNFSKEKVIKFDLTPPQIDFRNKGDLKDIVCTDMESGCAEVFYGFSKTNIDCKANKLYNSSIDIRDKYYLCVEAFDFANQKTYKIEVIKEFVDNGIGNQTGDENENSTDDGGDDGSENQNNNQTTSGDNEVDPLDPLDPRDPNGTDDKTGTGTIVTVAAIMLLVAGVGSGGYYAYRKGYLNDELEKLGIHLPKKQAGNRVDDIGVQKNNSGFVHKVSKNEVKQDNKAKFSTKPVSKINKSTYEEHLDKLNNFIDNKINKSDDLFDGFKETGKGKVDDYHDTLAKKKSFHNSKVSKEEFDEFYEKASKKGSINSSEHVSIEKEAEDFEQYLKKKDNKK